MYDQPDHSNERTAWRNDAQASAAYAGTERYVSLGDVGQALRRRFWVIALVTLVLVSTTVGASLYQTPVFEASAKLLVGQEQGDDLQPNLMGSIEGLQQLTHTMVQAVDSRSVAEEVIQRLDLQMSPETLLANLSAEQIEDTQFLLISYRDTDAERARRIVDAVSAVSSERFSESNASANEISVTIWETATVPDTPVSPDILRNALLALGVSLLLGTALVLLMDYLDGTWRSPEEVESASGVPTFGAIPKFEPAKGKNGSSTGLISVEDPTGVVSEAYRMVRTNLFYSVIDNPPKVLVLTSAGSSEGKTTTVANLGVTLAQAGKKVLMLDCDLRRPRLHEVFEARNEKGLVDVLVGRSKMEEVWQEPLAGVKVIFAGPPPVNPAEVLASRSLAEFLARVKQRFDFVLVDTPPIGFASETAALAVNGDAVLLILDSQKTRKGALRQALHQLRGVGANILGTVMNKYELPRGQANAYLQYHK